MRGYELQVWLGLKAISEAVSIFNYQLMWKYLDCKALGMQTVFDQTLKGLIKSFVFYSITSWLCFVKIAEAYNETIALIIAKVHYFALIWIYLWALVVVLTRYMIIFHYDVLENVEDSKYIKVKFTPLIIIFQIHYFFLFLRLQKYLWD